MSYLRIISFLFLILNIFLTIYGTHFFIFVIVGIFFKRRFPKTKKKHKYGIIIPARNEEKVVGNLIKSIQKNKYPQDKLQIFVIAHNCNDNTAKISRDLGAIVYEYNNPLENTMGYAFKYLFSKIEEDYGTQNYDGFFLFNADNILSVDYFEKMNDAFEYFKGERVITSCRNSKNFGANVISASYGLYFLSGCRFECRGRSVLDCSTRVQGTGYVINSKIVEDGWKYVTLTEDWEFTADQILQGRKITYCDDAVFYDEQPTTVKIMLRQRLRWARGHLLVFFSKGKSLFTRLFKRLPKEKNNKYSTYDILINVLPTFVITTVILLMELILVIFAPLFITNYIDLWNQCLLYLVNSIYIGYFVVLINGIMILICERKRINGVSPITKIMLLFFWPIFLLLSHPLSIISVFKKVEWKSIPHTDTTDIEKLSKVK